MVSLPFGAAWLAVRLPRLYLRGKTAEDVIAFYRGLFALVSPAHT